MDEFDLWGLQVLQELRLVSGAGETNPDRYTEGEQTNLKQTVTQVHEQSDRDQPIPLVVGLDKVSQSIEKQLQDTSPQNTDPESSEPVRGSIYHPKSPVTGLPSLDESASPQYGDHMPTSLVRAIILSTASVESNLLTHSWRRSVTLTISDLCSYIASTPTTHIRILKWCKDRKGIRHEFVLLEVARSPTGSLWLRLDRRPHRNATVTQLVSSIAEPADTAMLADTPEPLFQSSESEVKVEVNFPLPLPLENLGSLLSIIGDESKAYKLYPENCYFFCSVIYENLNSMAQQAETTGDPSRSTLSLALDVRAKIKSRMNGLLSQSSTPNSVLPDFLAAEISSVSSNGVPALVMPVIDSPQAGNTPWKRLKEYGRYPMGLLSRKPRGTITQQEVRYTDASHHKKGSGFIGRSVKTSEYAPSLYSIRDDDNATVIPLGSITTSRRGLEASVQAHFSNTPQPYPHDSGNGENNKTGGAPSLKASGSNRMDSWARPPQPQPARSGRSGRTKSSPNSGPGVEPVTSMRLPQISAPSGVAGKSTQPEGIKLFVSIDFGATHSGVSYASSTSGKVIPIISWPGSSDSFRKIPTCLVYDNLGDVRAWGPKARDINLRRGWVRCEWFKLLLDPDSAPISTSLPIGKQAPDLVVDFLSSLWTYAKGQILRRNALDVLNFAEVYLTVPASWDARTSLLLREVAVKAGLVVQVSRKDIYWQERLHIIPETEASAIHSVPLTRLRPDQIFMICDAGGSTIDIATYSIPRAWGTPEITEVSLRSGSYCGSLFLDIRFRELVRERLAGHPSHLDEASLAHFLLTFSGSEKLGYKGPVDDAKMFHFRCLRLQDSHDPSVGLEDGELIIPGRVLRREVFDPVVNQVLDTINRHMRASRMGINVLLLVGGFSANEYLVQRITDQFKSAIPSIVRPIDGDTASCRGAARSGLHPTVTSVIPSQNVVMRVRLPVEREDKRMRPAYIMTTAGAQFCDNRLQYLIKKRTNMHKGSRVDTELRKFSTAPYDSIFEAVLYTSNAEKTMRYTDQGETDELCLCRVDLKELPSFKEQAKIASSEGFYIDFELGFEMDTAEIRGVLLYKGKKFGSITFNLRD